MKSQQFDVMFEFELSGQPIAVSVYKRLDSLPRQGSRDVRDFQIANQFPAEHAPDAISEINNRIVLKLLNADGRCLCNTPLMAGLRPRHVGEFRNDGSWYFCDRSSGFITEEVQYFQRNRFGNKLFAFLQGGTRTIPDLLRSLAEDQWQIEVGSEALRNTWPSVPEIRLQADLEALLLDGKSA